MNSAATGREEAPAALLSPLIGCPDCLALILLPVLHVRGLNLNTSTFNSGGEEQQLESVHPTVLMAKRRAEDPLLYDAPSKRCCRSSLCSVDMQLGSMAPTGGLSPPSLLALLGSRSRKRPCYFEEPEIGDEEAALYRTATHCSDVRRHAANVLMVQTSGSFQDRRSCSAITGCKKRPREDCPAPHTAAAKVNNKAGEDTSAEDSTYNSFQFWRTPLPELDLCLLEEPSDQADRKDKSKAKDSSCDAMET